MDMGPYIRGKLAADMFARDYSAAILSGDKALQADFMARYRSNPARLAEELYEPLRDQMQAENTLFTADDIRRTCDYIAAVLAAATRRR